MKANIAMFLLVAAVFVGGCVQQGATSPSVSARNQEIVDGAVVIENVFANESGWMVIHADNNGPAAVIGYAPVNAGKNTNVMVEIDASAATPTLFAMLHYDRGEKGVYNAVDEAAPVIESGSVVMVPFSVSGNSQGSVAVVTITDSEFEPKTVTISAGDTVRWVNNGTGDSWPASAVHPTHRVYPGSDIAKCGTPESGSIFDACRGIKAGETYEFTFTEKGSWNYHDHLRPSLWGTVVVE